MAMPIKFSNISATTGTFTLAGGWYAITAIATWSSGSATLERLAADGTTFVTAATAISANGMSVVQLPPGVYKIVIASASAVYIDITAINLSNA